MPDCVVDTDLPLYRLHHEGSSVWVPQFRLQTLQVVVLHRDVAGQEGPVVAVGRGVGRARDRGQSSAPEIILGKFRI